MEDEDLRHLPKNQLSEVLTRLDDVVTRLAVYKDRGSHAPDDPPDGSVLEALRTYAENVKRIEEDGDMEKLYDDTRELLLRVVPPLEGFLATAESRAAQIHTEEEASSNDTRSKEMSSKETSSEGDKTTREESVLWDLEMEWLRQPVEVPSSEAVRGKRRARLRKTILTGLGVAAAFAIAAVLLSTFLLPVYNIRQSSMTPSLNEGEILVFYAAGGVDAGDIVAFNYSNGVLIKRVIAKSGDLVDINSDGEVSVNGVVLDEPYLSEQTLGECDVDLPIRVPEGRVFVMGDNRAVSLDSRYSGIGTVSEDQIAGRAFLRIWPLSRMKLF
jgi:signal peptidase I